MKNLGGLCKGSMVVTGSEVPDLEFFTVTSPPKDKTKKKKEIIKKEKEDRQTDID